MSVLAYRERVTVIDVLDAGACIEGVLEWVDRHGVIAVRTADYLGEEWIAKAAGADGSGAGYGYGQGDGSGNGYGSYGYGQGDGYGNGYGDGDMTEAAP